MIRFEYERGRISVEKQRIWCIFQWFVWGVMRSSRRAGRQVGVKTLKEVVGLIVYPRMTNKPKHTWKFPYALQSNRINIAIALARRRIETSWLLDWLGCRLRLVLFVGTLQCSFTPGRVLVWNDGCLGDIVHKTRSPKLSALGKTQASKDLCNCQPWENRRYLEHCNDNLANHPSLTEDDTK